MVRESYDFGGTNTSASEQDTQPRIRGLRRTMLLVSQEQVRA